MPNNIFDTHIDGWPHAICYVGDLSTLKKTFQEKDIDHITFEFSRMLLDDAKDLRAEISKKNPAGHNRVSIIKASSIGIAPQNALLKSIEEPAEGHKIIFCLSTLDGILPTIISRCLIIHEQGEKQNKDNRLIAWLAKNPKERLEEAEKWVKKAQKEQKTAELRAELLEMIISLEQMIFKQDKINNKYLLELEELRGYLQNQGASPKYILEYLALLLPSA